MSRSERNGDILQGRAVKAWRVEWNELALVVVDDTAGGAIARMIELDVGPKEITSVREADVRVLPPAVAPALPAVFFVARETYSGRTLGVALTAPLSSASRQLTKEGRKALRKIADVPEADWLRWLETDEHPTRRKAELLGMAHRRAKKAAEKAGAPSGNPDEPPAPPVERQLALRVSPALGARLDAQAARCSEARGEEVTATEVARELLDAYADLAPGAGYRERCAPLLRAIGGLADDPPAALVVSMAELLAWKASGLEDLKARGAIEALAQKARAIGAGLLTHDERQALGIREAS